jgi:hypothetical protein
VLLYHPIASLVDLCRGLVGRAPHRDTPFAHHPRAGCAGFTLVGLLTAGKSSGYSINGVDFDIEATTAIFGELRYGALTHVTGVYHRHTIRVATKIVVAPSRK